MTQTENTARIGTANGGQKRDHNRRNRRPPVPKVRTPRSSARRFNDLRDQLIRDLGREPRDILEQQMVYQAAALLLRSEQLSATICAGGKIGVRVGDQCIRLASEARRLLAILRQHAVADDPVKPQHDASSGPLRDRLAARDVEEPAA